MDIQASHGRVKGIRGYKQVEPRTDGSLYTISGDYMPKGS